MHPDLVALLALQEDDGVIAKLESGLRALDERVSSLDRERSAAADSLARARGTADQEEKRRRDLAGKVMEHKALQDRNLATLDAVRKPKEAAAAMAQIDLTRKVLAQEESDLNSLTSRIKDLHEAVEVQELEVAAVDERQAGVRRDLEVERETLTGEMQTARVKREQTATKVSRSALTKYERIRSRGQSAAALFPLNGAACGQCNTAIPLQRRNVLAAGQAIDVCEGCGVLLYAV